MFHIGSKIEDEEIVLHSFTIPLSLTYSFRLFRKYYIVKVGCLSSYYPFTSRNISFQQKWDYGFVTRISTSFRGFSLNLDAYFGNRQIKIEKIKIKNNTYIFTLGIPFYKLTNIFKKK